MAYSCLYCIKKGMKVKSKRCISVIFAARVILCGIFVFGETKRPAEADPFVVPQLALRLMFQ